MTPTDNAADALELFAPVAAVAPGTKREAIAILVAEIEPDPDQPRTKADNELQASIRVHGVMQPITVFPHPDPAKVAAGIKYIIDDGERRYWGTIEAGFDTIPAFIDERSFTDIQRLIRQAIANEHEKLPPMDEANLYLRIKDATGWPDARIAKEVHKPKSTVSDRLALAMAPEAFRPLFLSGLFSPAAAPVVRKFSEVPTKILELAARTAPEDPAIATAKRAGKSAEIKDVSRILDKIILDESLRELPEHLVLLYEGGQTCKVGGVIYATEVAKLLSAQREYEKEQARNLPLSTKKVDAAKGTKAQEKLDLNNLGYGAKTATTSGPIVSPPSLTASERKKAETEDRARQDAKLDNAAWNQARPKILAAVGKAVESVKVTGRLGDPLVDHLLNLIANAGGVDEATSEKLVGRPKDASAFIRYAVMAVLAVDIEDDAPQSRDVLPRTLKKLGLHVDLLGLVHDEKKLLLAPRKAAAQKPEPKKPSAKKAPKAKVAKPAKKTAKRKGK